MKLILTYSFLLILTSYSYAQTDQRDLTTDLNTIKTFPDSLAYSTYYYFLNNYVGPRKLENRAIAYMSIARLHDKNFNSSKAIENALNAQRLYFCLNKYDKIGETYNFIGNCFLNINKVEPAIKNYEKSLSIASYFGDSVAIGTAHNNLAGAYYKQNNQIDSKKHFKKSIEILDALNNMDMLINCKLNYSALCMDYDSDKALQILKECEVYFKDEVTPFFDAMVRGNLGAVFYRKNEIDLGINYYMESLKISEHHNFKNITKVNFLDLSEIYHQIGNDERAYYYYVKYDSIKNITTNSLELQQTAQLEFNHYIAIQKEKTDELNLRFQKILSEKRELYYFLWLAAATIIFSIAIITLSALFYRSKIQRAKQKKEILAIKNKLVRNNLHQSEVNNEKLKYELDMNKEDLINFSIDNQRKNDAHKKLHEGIKLLKKKAKGNHELMHELRELAHLSATIHSLNEDTNAIAENIEKVNHEFFTKLTEQFPRLTTNEKKLCGLIRIKTSNKEIASIRGISPKSVEMSRYRLKKKLALNEGENLDEFIEAI
ncbi:MAG: tetratricopeptide (TPR) repeat protein [Crocinitomix sp.]|jgi:tetratricopeptide (TPR) repeat protein